MSLPQDGRVEPLAADGVFRFRCHPGVSCFTECCRRLDLELSPYDVIRLRRALEMDGEAFLNRYAEVSFAPDDPFPKVFLAMNDDEEKACPFVGAGGCAVYPHRPGPCRLYPLGRGVGVNEDGTIFETIVLIREDHCLGFAEDREQDIAAWRHDQDLGRYLEHNDRLLPLLRHRFFRDGGRLDQDTALEFLHALYLRPAADNETEELDRAIAHLISILDNRLG